mgnify:CR=1 FL=1
MSKNEWKETAFNDMADLIKDGYHPTGSDNFKYIGLEHIDQQSLSLNSVGHSTEVGSNKFRFKGGDILFGKLRPYFRKVYRPRFDGVCSTDIWVVRAKNGIDQGYLFYRMASHEFVDMASSGSSGTRMPRADWNHLKDTRWPVPSLPTQKKIAKILGDLDEKIELNHQMNKTLESIAQAVFKKWFVGFEFPGHEKTKFVNGLPEGWREGTLSEICNIIMGQSPPGETYNESGNGVPFYQGNRDFGYRFPTARVFCSAPTRFADTRDILVSVRAPVGALNIALEKCCIGRGVAALRMKNHSNGFLFYFLATQDDLWNRFNSEGTVFGCLNKSEFNKIDLVIPSDDVLAGFDRFVVSIEAMLWKNEEENRRLSGIRDSLLPKLMSGEVVV